MTETIHGPPTTRGASRRPALLLVRNVDVRFGDRMLLREINLTVRGRGIRALMGPGGAGKSTLLRVLSQSAGTPATLETTGRIWYQGVLVGRDADAPRPFLVDQRLTLTLRTGWELLRDAIPARSTLLVAQQIEMVRDALRRVGLESLEPRLDLAVVDLDRATRAAIAALRALLSGAALVLFDEPTTGLDDNESLVVLRIMREVARKRAVLWVTHRLDLVRRHANRVSLLVTGRLVASASTREFFASTHPVVVDFVRTGSCVIPDESTPRWALAPRARASVATTGAQSDPTPRGSGPSGFRWLHDGRLAGAAQPGLIGDIAHDLDALARAGVSTLVTLTESPVAEGAEFDRFGLSSIFFPIPDGRAPTLELALELLATVEALLADGECVAFHCKAGKGRTGMMLAACLVWDGIAADQAIRTVRLVDRGWIQTTEQERFLEVLADAVGQRRVISPKSTDSERLVS